MRPIPRDALDFFRQKSLRPAFSYLDVWREEHNTAFTVAKVMEKGVLETLRTSLDKALAQGETFKDWSSKIKDTLDKSGWSNYGNEKTNPSRLVKIYETNMRVARAVGQWQRVQRTKTTHPYLQYYLGPSEVHRPEHAEWDGLVLPVDDPWWDEHYPPNGWGCFLPGTSIDGAMVGGSKAFYTGEAIEIELQSGARLSVTPNHPIATKYGWCPAGRLEVGQQCLSYHWPRNNIGSGPRPRGVDDHQIPPRVEDVFNTLTVNRAQALLTSSDLDFHGEAGRFVGKVHVVGSYVPLVNEFQTMSSAQQIRQRQLTFSDLSLSNEPRRGHELELTGLFLSSARHSVGSTNLFQALSLRAPTPNQDRRFMLTTDLEPAGGQKVSQDFPVYSKFLTQLLQRLSGLISFDPIVRLRRFNFSGHVYDLETTTGWLLASNIVASNCNCGVRQLTAREAEALGVDVPPEEEYVEWVNPATGETELLPRGVDPGWDFNPGKERQQQLEEEATE